MNLDKEFCTYESYADINKRMKEFIDNEDYEGYDLIFITDISVSIEVAKLIDVHFGEKCLLLDHHKTALALNGYSWAYVVEEHMENAKASGTSLVKQWLAIHGLYNYNSENFVEKVRRYDTWEWHDKFNDLEAKKLADLFRIYGRNDFFIKYKGMLRCVDNDLFDKTDNRLLELEQKKIDSLVYKKNKQLKIVEFHGYKVGMVFAEDYISELGNRLCVDNPEIDFAVIVTLPYTFSFRGVGTKIDLGKFAEEHYGGGGHFNSAGASISAATLNNILTDMGMR